MEHLKSFEEFINEGKLHEAKLPFQKELNNALKVAEKIEKMYDEIYNYMADNREVIKKLDDVVKNSSIDFHGFDSGYYGTAMHSLRQSQNSYWGNTYKNLKDLQKDGLQYKYYNYIR